MSMLPTPTYQATINESPIHTDKHRSNHQGRRLFATSVLRCIALIAALASHSFVQAQRRATTASPQRLQVTFGREGLESLTYLGKVLEDVSRFPFDTFHIWHMKVTDLSGKTLSGGQNDWGERNTRKTWDANAHTWTYLFTWGTISVQYVVNGSSLDVDVRETNRAGSGVILGGASIYPLVLHLSSKQPLELSDNISGPSVQQVDTGSGFAALVNLDAVKPLYSGFSASPSTNQAAVLISSTSPDALPAFAPHRDRLVTPGNEDHFRVSLRFSADATDLATKEKDVFHQWSTQRSASLHWTDRRPIGTVYLADSPEGTSSLARPSHENPRRFFHKGTPDTIDITTRSGLAQFQQRLLDQAETVVINLRRIGAQGAITWDIEGEQYPQPTSYVCSPDQIGVIAPEMESVVQDASSPFRGMKLDDAYFKTIRDAGFRVGVCVRPQHYVAGADGQFHQQYLAPESVAGELIRKMKYAHDRWGATLFYADSTVADTGAIIDAVILKQAASAMPDSLLIPEESTLAAYGFTAPFKSFIFHHELGSDPRARLIYPRAFSANLVNDAPASAVIKTRDQLVQSVRAGDVLMLHADYWPETNNIVADIYRSATKKR